MAAVVAPIGVEDAKLRLDGITTLLLEVVYNLAEVVGIHRKTISLAIGGQILLLHLAETLQHSHRLNLRTLHVCENVEVLLARLYRVDKILLDACHSRSINTLIEDI